MKKLLLLSVLGITFLLAACQSLESYEETLEDAGWNVSITTVEDLPDFIDKEEVSEDHLVGIMLAQKGTSMGVIIEYNSRQDARDAHSNFVGDSSETEDNIIQKGSFVFISYSDSFYDDLKMS